MQVEQIDREAAASFMCPSANGWFQAHATQHPDDNETMLYLAQAFARHRHQARAEVVKEIVAMLRDDTSGPMFAICFARRIEAKFGGRDAS